MDKYKIKNGIKYLFFFSVMILLYSCVLTNKNVVHNNAIDYIQEDYNRDDLLFITGIGNSEGEISCTWKISLEELEKQGEKSFNELVDNIDMLKLINNGTYFINNFFGKIYSNKMYFHSIGYITINNDKYGNSTNIKRNDWIIILSYNSYSNDFNEKVFVLPDYRIIISSNNYEEI